MESLPAKPRTRPDLLVAIDTHCAPLAWHGARTNLTKHLTVVRIRETGLRASIRRRAQLRAEWEAGGNDPADLAVALEVDVLVAQDARAARAELRRLGGSQCSETAFYVGTAAGLKTLISDIYVAEVADAVILRPIVPTGAKRGVMDALIDEHVLPALRQSRLASAS